MSQLKIDSNRSLQLPLTVCNQLGSDPLEALSSSAEHLLLGRRASDSPVLIAGTLGEISVPDLLSFFNMFRKSGVLSFEFDDGDKALYFQKGEVVFATSTFANEDLGEILFALGKVERKTLNEAYQLDRGGIRSVSCWWNGGSSHPKTSGWQRATKWKPSSITCLPPIGAASISRSVLSIRNSCCVCR